MWLVHTCSSRSVETDQTGQVCAACAEAAWFRWRHLLHPLLPVRFFCCPVLWFAPFWVPEQKLRLSKIREEERKSALKLYVTLNTP